MTEPLDQPLSAPADWDDPPQNEHADRALDFIKACPLTKDKWATAGQTIGDQILPWQEKLTRHIFGTVDENGFREYDTVYCEMPKKSGKSTYLAAVMLYLLIADNQQGGELYSAAYKKDQAKVVWRIARDMAEAAPWLDRRTDIKDYKNEIHCPPLNAVYKPVTRKSVGQHGFNPSAVAFDELHVQPDRELWDTIDDSLGARTEPLLFAITNAGHDRQSICYAQREYAMDCNSGRFDDDSFLGVIYGAEKDDDPWEPETWRKANPGLGRIVDLDWMESKAQKARRLPSKQNAFFRWQLGRWTQAEQKWLDPDQWQKCEAEIDPERLEGEVCYGGLDLGSVSDLSSWVLAFPDLPWTDEREIWFLTRSWCPEPRLYADDNPYRDQYQKWVKQGDLTAVETGGGRAMRPEVVQQQILQDAEDYRLVQMAMDAKFQGVDIAIELLEDHGISVATMGQGYNHMTSPCRELDRRINSEPPLIRHDGNGPLAWAASNVALKHKTGDEDAMKPIAENRDAKVDPIDALLFALDQAQRHEETDLGPSKYEEEDVLVL